MLTHLHIENIALVDKLDLNFDPGLSVLSGETGAGKSVIVTAIALALGDRAEKEFIRQGWSIDPNDLPGTRNAHNRAETQRLAEEGE